MDRHYRSRKKRLDWLGHFVQRQRHEAWLYQLAVVFGGVCDRIDQPQQIIDDMVTLPGYTRADAAVYYSITEKIRLQGNVENLFNAKYYLNADSNTNLSPGSSRAVRVGLIARF